MFLHTNTNRKMDDGYTAPPTTGTWNQGDIVLKASPVTGDPLGWVCRVTGTPGQWKPFGIIKDRKVGSHVASGDGVATSLTIPHGLGVSPSFHMVGEASLDAGNAEIKYVAYDSTNLTVFFKNALASGANNISLRWEVEV